MGPLAEEGDLAHHLVAGHEVVPVPRQVARDDVQVGAAHPTGPDVDQDLARPGLRDGQLGPGERVPAQRSRLVDDPRLHGAHGASLGSSAGRAHDLSRSQTHIAHRHKGPRSRDRVPPVCDSEPFGPECAPPTGAVLI